jgi:hypothetical protein
MPSPEELSEHSDCGESGKSILFSKEFDSFLQGSEIFSPSSVQEVSLSDMFGELFGEVGNDPCIFSNFIARILTQKVTTQISLLTMLKKTI